jgi:hypothetical protein
MTGYLHPAYAESLAEFGTPRLLPRSGGWLLERAVAGFPDRDAIGCYPLFACRDWTQLLPDFDETEGLVSLTVVTDPFGRYTESDLRLCFRDLVVPFKEHFVVDLEYSADTFVQPHHRRNARKALRELQVDHYAQPVALLDDWVSLYATLVARHQITGIAAFSRESFAQQFAVPGLVAHRAEHKGETVGMLLWYVQGDVGYYHLGAYSLRGYDLRASFALFSYAIEDFGRRGLRWLNLGAAPRREANGASGLARFKEGWASGTRTAYLCGRVFDTHRYAEIARAKNVLPTSYFPAYRAGEFH